MGLRGKDVNFYAYGLNNPLHFLDYSGASAIGDAGSGVASYFQGIGDSFRHAGRAAGLHGSCEQLRAGLENLVLLQAVTDFLSANPDTDVGPELDAIRDYVLNHKAKIAGRFATASLITTGLSMIGGQTGLAVGVGLNVLSLHGNLRSSIEGGGRKLSDLVNSVIGGEILPSGSGSSCSKSNQ